IDDQQRAVAAGGNSMRRVGGDDVDFARGNRDDFAADPELQFAVEHQQAFIVGMGFLAGGNLVHAQHLDVGARGATDDFRAPRPRQRPGNIAEIDFAHAGRTMRSDQRFIALKNSSLVLVFFILSSMNSIAASSSIGCSSLRRIQIFCSMSGGISSSSRRVPERLMLMEGSTRFSEMRRSRCTSMLPVPLNSS